MLTGVTLAMDAAAGNGTIAVFRDAQLVAEADVVMRSERDERFFPALLETLSRAGLALGDLSQIVVGGGPGSFTALRVVGAIAKGIAQARRIPLYALPSLALVAPPLGSPLDSPVGSPSSSPTGDAAGAVERWLVTLDALRGERYAALVERERRRGYDDAHDVSSSGAVGEVIRVEQLGVIPVALLPERAAALRARLLGPDEALQAQPHARELRHAQRLALASGAVDLASWEPSYGRLAEAQVKWEAAQGRPLR